MFPHDEFKLTRQAILALLVSAAFSPAANAAPAGTVVFAVGDVSATASNGQVRRLIKGTEVAVGDTIVTGANGRAQVRFTDGAFSSFQPETRFRVDQYQYEGKTDGSEKGFFSLLKGALRTITGAIGHVNKKNYQVATPTATIGIRGTEYLAREGNSLSVSVGEGQIEICNAAGCLIVSDGESAYVKDGSTQPEFTQERTQAGPPEWPPKLHQFSVSEERNSSGELIVLETATPLSPPPPPVTPPPPPLVSGPGYIAAAAGQFGISGYSYPTYLTASSVQPGIANFDAAGALTSFSADGAEGNIGNISMTAGVIAGGFTDGIIGWGRWDSGTGTSTNCSYFSCEGSAALTDWHYVVGQPTPAADMMALYSANKVGTYSLLGYTFPTAVDSSGNRTVGTQPVTGSLTAYFGTQQRVDVTLGVPIGGNQFGISASADLNSTSPGGPDYANPATFYGYGTVSGTSYGSAYISGLFAGANASRAGLVYQFDTYGAAYEIGTVSGAAAFTQTSLVTPPLPDGANYISAMAGQYTDYESVAGNLMMPSDREQFPGVATFDVAGALRSYSSVIDDCNDNCLGTFYANPVVIAQSGTDGVIGWGRWTSGDAYDSGTNFVGGSSATLQNVHYVVGQPTSVTDMNGLQIASAVGTYSLIGYTSPTSSTGAVGTLPVTGSLTANFGTGNLGVTLGVPIGGNTFGISGSASFNAASPTNPAAFYGNGLSVTNTSGGTAAVSGMFVGANASRAGLVYQFDTTYASNPVGTVSGAAAFAKN